MSNINSIFHTFSGMCLWTLNQTALAATRDFFKDKQTCKTFIASVPCCIRNNNEDFSKSVQLRSADARPRRDELEISNDEFFFSREDVSVFFLFWSFLWEREPIVLTQRRRDFWSLKTKLGPLLSHFVLMSLFSPLALKDPAPVSRN